MEKKYQIPLILGSLIISFIITQTESKSVAQLVAFLLLWVIPAYLFSYRIKGESREEQLLTAFSLALFLTAIGTLLLHYLPGIINRWEIIILATLQIAVATYLARNAQPKAKISLPPLLLILFLIGILFRISYLGYSEFQGDEAVSLVRTADMILGDETELFLHQKGPIELLVPLPAWALTNQTNEFWARAPFAWASILSLLALLILSRKWLGAGKEWPVLALFLICGFSIAFGRIVQYQSFVLLWGINALIQATNYQRTEKKEYLYLTALFFAAALLSHYDAILMSPAIAFLIFTPIYRHKKFNRKEWLLAIGIGIFLLSLFYIPFIRNPNFARTLEYLISDRVGANESRNWQNWSGGRVWQMLTFYNSTYYIFLLIILVLANLLPAKRKVTAEYRWPLFLTFAVPVLFYMLIVVDPRTHIYTFFPGALILASSGFFRLTDYLPQRPLSILFTLVWLASSWYIYLLFINHAPHKTIPAFYWTSWETEPEFGLFGFPHQSGWRQLHSIIPPENLRYASNEEKEVTQWYMQQAPRTHCPNFSHFIIADQVQDPIPYDPTLIDSLNIAHIINLQRTPSLTLYTPAHTNTRNTDADQAIFWQSPSDVAHPIPQPQVSIESTFYNPQSNQPMVTFLGYDYEIENQLIWITLYWESLAPFDDNYQTFVHLYDGQTMWAQHDSAPECTHNPTSRWEPGSFIADPHPLLIPEDTPSNTVFYVGIYNLLTGERLSNPQYPNQLIPLSIQWLDE